MSESPAEHFEHAEHAEHASLLGDPFLMQSIGHDCDPRGRRRHGRQP